MNGNNLEPEGERLDAVVDAILVFVVAYNAERHIQSVFERIPAEIFANPDVYLLVIDDASSDSGTRVISAWLEDHGVERATVLRNVVNQGYGGNQKLGFRFAIDGGFDFVILLHGDGQYAPELLPHFIETWRETRVDVVLGSRMREVRRAREGGMPLYKVIGNRMLTKVQNYLTGLSLTEYHTGYRGYATRFLKRVPFEINTNVFHFDTEILLQAAGCHASVIEFDIPTHYGDEVCHVNGVRYAFDVMVATVRFWLNRYGVFCSLKYRGLEQEDGKRHERAPYTSHVVAAKLIREYGPHSLLNIGRTSEVVSAECVRQGIDLTELDIASEAQGTTERVDRFQRDHDLTSLDPMNFDMVLMLDVVEHFSNPEEILVGFRNRSTRVGAIENPSVFVISTPNIAFVALRLNLLLGRFSYADRGILHVMHKRLFTLKSLRNMLEDSGYDVVRLVPLAVPFERVIGGRIGCLLERGSCVLARVWPTLFAFQFLIACRPRPGVRQLLGWAEKHHLTEEVHK